MIIDDDPIEGYDKEKAKEWLNKMYNKRISSSRNKIIIIHGDSPEGKKLTEELKKQFDKLNDPNFK